MTLSLVLTLAAIATSVLAGPGHPCAQERPVAPERAVVSESCANDLLTTGEYASLLLAQRNAYEVDIARLRAHVRVLEAAVESTKAKAPEKPMPEGSGL